MARLGPFSLSRSTDWVVTERGLNHSGRSTGQCRPSAHCPLPTAESPSSLMALDREACVKLGGVLSAVQSGSAREICRTAPISSSQLGILLFVCLFELELLTDLSDGQIATLELPSLLLAPDNAWQLFAHSLLCLGAPCSLSSSEIVLLHETRSSWSLSPSRRPSLALPAGRRLALACFSGRNSTE